MRISVAAEMVGLYEASVEITDQSSRSQDKAKRQAFREVLVKVSGSKDLLRFPEIRQQITRADDYLLSYRYESDQNTLFYLAEFDPQRIEKVIRQNGFPIWGSRRPDTIIWLALQEQGVLKRSIISESSHFDLIKLANETAKSRGLAISFPILDLEDIQQIGVYDVWGGFIQSVATASERYGTDVVMSARIYFYDFDTSIESTDMAPLRAPSWVANWSLLDGAEIQTGNIVGDDPENLTVQLINQLADSLASKYAIIAKTPKQGEEKLKVTITNISDLSQYVKVRAFLASLSVVAKATLVVQDGNNATFELDMLGSDSDLRNALRLDDKIRPLTDDFGQDIQEHQYVWLPE